MSQEFQTPDEKFQPIADRWFQESLKLIPPDSRCEVCFKYRWFCKDRNGIKLCGNCFEEMHY